MKILPTLPLLAILSVASGAQISSPDNNTLHLQSRLVVLDVVVTDRDGEPLSGFGIKDFSVTEEGVPQSIRTAEYISNGSGGTSGPEHTVFVLDNLNGSLNESTYAQSQLLKYLATQPSKLSAPAMLVTLNDRGFQMLVSCTRDRDKLLAAAHEYQPGIPYDLAHHVYEDRLNITFDALRQIALASSGSTQRTELIWLGHGFPAITLTNLPPETASQLKAEVARITNLLLKARIVVYKVDPSPVGAASSHADPNDLESAFDESREPYTNSISFDGITLQKGGHCFFNRNDIHAELASAVKLGESFYTITYTPISDDQSAVAYRHIRVSVDKPGAKVSARLGYFATPDATLNSTSDPDALVNTAIINNLPYTALRFHVEGFSRAVDGITHCTLRLAPESADWDFSPSEVETIHLVAGIAVYGTSGKFLTYLRDTAILNQRQNEDKAAQESSLVFNLNLRLPPSNVSLRVVLLNPKSGQLGSATVASVPQAAHSVR